MMKKLISLIINELTQRKNYVILLISVLIFSFTLFLLGGEYSLIKTINYTVGILDQESYYFIDIVFFIVLILNSFILPNLLFRYLHKPTESPYVSSLPYKKNELFISKYIAGIIIGYIPLIIYLGLIFVIRGKVDFLMSALLLVTILFFYYYNIGSLASVLSGKATFQVMLTIAFYFVPLFIYYAYMALMANTIVGAVNTELSINVVKYLFVYLPGIKDLVCIMDTSLWNGYLFYSLTSLGAFVLTLIVNHFRKIESSGETSINKWFTFIVKHVVIVVISLIISSLYVTLFRSIAFGQFIYFGIIMAMVSYIVEMVFTGNKKSFSIYKTMIPLYLVIALITNRYTNYYTYYVPDTFKSLEVTTTAYFPSNVAMSYRVNQKYYESFKELHESLITSALNQETARIELKEDVEIKNNYYMSYTLTFRYQLNNGSIVSRQYNVDYTILQYYLSPLAEDDEYIKSYYQSTYDLLDSLDNINYLYIDDYEYQLDEELREELKKAIQLELLKDINNNINPLYYCFNTDYPIPMNYYDEKAQKTSYSYEYYQTPLLRALEACGLYG